MKNNFFYSLIFALAVVLNSCSFFEKNQPTADISLIKKKATDAENNNKTDSAFYYLNTISIDNNYTLDNVVYSKLEKAKLYYNLCDFSECEAEAIEAKRINKNPIYNPYINNMLGTAFQEQKKYEEAIENFQLALKDNTNYSHIELIINNIGVVYLDDKKYEEAIKIYKPLLINDSLKKHTYTYAKVLDNLGYAYLNTNHPETYSLLTRSLFLKDSIEDSYSKISSLMHLANYYEKNFDIQKTNEFAIRAYKIATTSKSPDDRLEALDILIKNNKNNKEWYLKYAHINDSIQRERNRQKNQFAQIKYDATKAESKSKIHKEQKEKLTLAIIAIVAFSIFTFILLRIKNKQKQLKTVYETETRIAKQLHDELANDMFNTLTFAENQDISIAKNKEKIVNNLEEIYKRTRSISHQNSTIKVDYEFKTELRTLLNNFITQEIQVVTKGIDDVNWENIESVKKITLYRVLQELMINMKKHSQCSLVFITITSSNKVLEIKYADNGVGIKKEKHKNGLLNVENRINSVNGTITFESNNGLKVKITIPI